MQGPEPCDPRRLEQPNPTRMARPDPARHCLPTAREPPGPAAQKRGSRPSRSHRHRAGSRPSRRPCGSTLAADLGHGRVKRSSAWSTSWSLTPCLRGKYSQRRFQRPGTSSLRVSVFTLPSPSSTVSLTAIRFRRGPGRPGRRRSVSRRKPLGASFCPPRLLAAPQHAARGDVLVGLGPFFRRAWTR